MTVAGTLLKIDARVCVRLIQSFLGNIHKLNNLNCGEFDLMLGIVTFQPT